jgi:hypothetical protein
MDAAPIVARVPICIYVDNLDILVAYNMFPYLLKLLDYD